MFLRALQEEGLSRRPHALGGGKSWTVRGRWRDSDRLGEIIQLQKKTTGLANGGNATRAWVEKKPEDAPFTRGDRHRQTPSGSRHRAPPKVPPWPGSAGVGVRGW
jgi:hypothetical protein